MFLRACRNYGMKEVDVFQTQDLYETKAIYSVSIFKSIYLTMYHPTKVQIWLCC